MPRPASPHTTRSPRLTPQTARILAGFLAAPDHPRYGQQAVAATGLSSGTVHTILRRLESCGWLVAERENDEVAHPQRRPSRIYYRLTEHGSELARVALRARAAHLRALTRWTDALLTGDGGR